MSRRVFVVANVGLTLLAASSLPAEPQQGSRYSVPFSDPSRPGTVRINLMHSSITVKGANGRDVIIVAQAHDGPRRPAPPDSGGLRRLDPPAGVNIQEENNVLTIHGTWPGGPTADIEVEVPVKTNLILRAMKGDLMVEGVDGEIEATAMAGSIALTNVSGSVVAHASNGRIAATVARVTPDRPMAFTSLNGNVDVTLPPAVKADLKLGSNRGDVFSDFDVQLKPGAPSSSSARAQSRGGYRFVADRSIYGSVNGGGPLFQLRTINGNVYLRKAKNTP